MKEVVQFLDLHYENAKKLVHDFCITKKKDWDSTVFLNELYVQVGHVFNVLHTDLYVKEEGRVINNLGDEISDVLLQIINFAESVSIDMREIKEYKEDFYEDINGIPVLMGQISEATMEMNEYRFAKNRVGYASTKEFIKDRVYRLFILTCNLAKKYNLDIIKEFDAMLVDANGFLDRYRLEHSIKKED